MPRMEPGYRFLTFALPAILVAAVCSGGQPTRTSISLDGSFDDWQTVFANPENLILDGDGSTVPCPDSADRDCIVSSKGADIRRFAVTWDDENLYLYVERMEASNSRVFLLYVDTGHDGFFGGDDYVLEHLFRASQSSVLPVKRAYVPLAPGGDPTEDALGLGDGYSVPGGASGDISGAGDPVECMTCTSGDGLSFEFAWPWSSLGVSPGQAVIYHLAGAGSALGVKDDNAGGPGDRRGSTGFHFHTFDGARVQAGAPGTAVWMPHQVRNEGNREDVLNFEVASSLGMQVCIYDDPDGDGTPDALMGCDKQGNESWDESGDFVDPAHDRDQDTRPDTGILPPGGVFRFVGEILPSKGDNRLVELTRYRAVSAADELVAPWVEDETAVGKVTIIPRRQLKVVPGATFNLPHRIANHLPTIETFDIYWQSENGWDYTAWSDPDEDGDPSDGVMLFDTDGDTDPDVNVPSGETFPVVVQGAVPAGTALGTLESLTVTVRETGSLTGEVVDEVLVSQVLELRPDHTLANGLYKSGSSNYPTFFRHYLTWNGDRPARFDLSAFSALGYEIDFFTDPNGDGSPADGRILGAPAQSPELAPFGGTWVFLARVGIPPGTPGGTVDTATITAALEGFPAFFVEATDETRATLIQPFKDLSHTVALSHASVCSTLYARATGMLPSAEGIYRIVWDDPVVTRQRTMPITPDGKGEGFDSLSLPASAMLGAWSLALQEYDGISWTDLDRVPIEVENEGVLDALHTESESYSIASSSVTATAVFRNGGIADLGPLEILFRIFTPDESRYLDRNGSFQPAAADQDTWSLKNLRLESGEAITETFSVTGVAWPEPGPYILEASWKNVCGQAVARTRRTFFVTSDADGDGLTDDIELAHGLDWLDRDSDDDGFGDGIEGVTDSDGDTLVDALDCDSDADTLPDSLEGGLVEGGLDEDTDLLAGCFLADGDAGATTTDRLSSDSDHGGLTDGEEDLDADGVVDPGERDPNAAWDDPCRSTAPPEVERLLVERQGGNLLLTWTGLAGSHPCARYRVWESPVLPPALNDLTVVADDLDATTWTTPEPGGLRTWLVQASGPFSGDGPLGYLEP